MYIRKLIRHPLTQLLIAFAVIPLLLSACQPVNASTSLPSPQPSATTDPAPLSTATQAPPALATLPVSGASAAIALDFSGVAQNQAVETVEAVTPSDADSRGSLNMPAYRRVTLQGYPAAQRQLKPQIFAFPVKDLDVNVDAAEAAKSLQALLQDQQVDQSLPFLPLYNSKQVMHAQVQYLDFKNGKGVRFLTQYDQGPLKINNVEMIYTFQGLTSDGKTYLAAVLPVSHPELPADAQVYTQQAGDMTEFPAYLAKTVAWLDQQPAGNFTPDLAKLDALIQSIEVK